MPHSWAILPPGCPFCAALSPGCLLCLYVLFCLASARVLLHPLEHCTHHCTHVLQLSSPLLLLLLLLLLQLC
jgi:hypothetical protein